MTAVLAVLAAITFGVAYLLDLAKATPPGALTPPALHLAGADASWRHRP